MKKARVEEANLWWNNTEFHTMEYVTGYYQEDFSPEEGYQDFVDACDEWWERKNDTEKINIYMEFIN